MFNRKLSGVEYLWLKHRVGWCRGSALDLYSGGARFEYRPGHWPSWLMFLVAFPQSLPDSRSISIRPQPLPYKFFPIYYYSPIILPSDAIQNVPGGKVNIRGGYNIGHSKINSMSNHNSQLILRTDSHASDIGALRREGRKLLRAKYRKPFGIGHMFTYIFVLRMADIMTSQNIDLSSLGHPV
jgi:hypothetical protein